MNVYVSERVRFMDRLVSQTSWDFKAVRLTRAEWSAAMEISRGAWSWRPRQSMNLIYIITCYLIQTELEIRHEDIFMGLWCWRCNLQSNMSSSGAGMRLALACSDLGEPGQQPRSIRTGLTWPMIILLPTRFLATNFVRIQMFMHTDNDNLILWIII